MVLRTSQLSKPAAELGNRKLVVKYADVEGLIEQAAKVLNMHPNRYRLASMLCSCQRPSMIRTGSAASAAQVITRHVNRDAALCNIPGLDLQSDFITPELKSRSSL